MATSPTRAGTRREDLDALNGVSTTHAASNGLVPRGESGFDPARVSPASDDRVCKILELIVAEVPHRISDVAVEINLSESHLQHLFKRETGLCLGHVLAEQRMLKAAVLLVRSNLRIKAIAAAVGYRHTSSFTRAFEKRFAQAPQTFRKRRSLRRP